MKSRSEIAEIIRKLRLQSGMKQYQTAKLTNQGPANYSNKERGETPFSLEEICQIVEIFKEYDIGAVRKSLQEIFEIGLGTDPVYLDVYSLIRLFPRIVPYLEMVSKALETGEKEVVIMLMKKLVQVMEAAE